MPDRQQVSPGFWNALGRVVSIEHTTANPWNTDISTAQTIHQMSHLVNAQFYSALVNEAVNDATANLPDSASDEEIARAIFWWVKRHVQFSEDEELMHSQLGIKTEDLDKELLIPPTTLLQMPVPTGDCDDFSMLVAAMLKNVGMRVKFVTIAADESMPWKFSHVFVRTKDDKGNWVSLDASHGPYPGWQTKQNFREQEWDV